MTAQFRALSDLVDDIEYRFSAAGLAARHSPTRIKQLFNVSWQTMREEVSLVSDGSYLKATATASLPTSAAVSGEVYAEIDWPVGAIGVYGVRVLLNNRWYPLKRIPFAAYQDYQFGPFLDSLLVSQGPIGYTSVLLPDGDSVTPANESVGKVMIVPVPTTGSYRLWYLEAWTPRTADTAVFPGHSLQTEFAIWDCLCKMAMPDKDSGQVYQKFTAERDRALGLIKARASNQMGDDVLEPRNAREDGHQELWSDELTAL